MNARDDERPRDIALALGLDADEVVDLNRKTWTGLKAASRLHAGTQLRIPGHQLAPDRCRVVEVTGPAPSPAAERASRLHAPLPDEAVGSGSGGGKERASAAQRPRRVFTAEKIIKRRQRPRVKMREFARNGWAPGSKGGNARGEYATTPYFATCRSAVSWAEEELRGKWLAQGLMCCFPGPALSLAQPRPALPAPGLFPSLPPPPLRRVRSSIW